jgi:hypothetical protein
MGHESRIEPWSPHLTAFCFAGFGTDRLRRAEVMKTASRENPITGATRPATEHLVRKFKTAPAQSCWPESKKKSGRCRGVFSRLSFL